MRNFFLGFITALLLVGVSYGVYKFVIYPRTSNIARENQGTCAHLKSGAADFGKVEVTISSASNQSVKGVEVNLGKQPGANNYCWAETTQSGLATFEQVPVGNYFLYFNDTTLPSALGGGEPSPTLQIDVVKDGITKADIELK